MTITLKVVASEHFRHEYHHHLVVPLFLIRKTPLTLPIEMCNKRRWMSHLNECKRDVLCSPNKCKLRF